jgi:hypothetical protein
VTFDKLVVASGAGIPGNVNHLETLDLNIAGILIEEIKFTP